MIKSWVVLSLLSRAEVERADGGACGGGGGRGGANPAGSLRLFVDRELMPALSDAGITLPVPRRGGGSPAPPPIIYADDDEFREAGGDWHARFDLVRTKAAVAFGCKPTLVIVLLRTAKSCEYRHRVAWCDL